MSNKETIDYDEHWAESVDTYKAHPTSRHRRRFIHRCLRAIEPRPGMSIFDYGCGAGLLLEEVSMKHHMPQADLGGCDISQVGIAAASRRLPQGSFILGEFPVITRKIDVAITSEVIEHTVEYEKILRWLSDNLSPGGHLIITTPGGTLDPPDHYYGHTQHFSLSQLEGILSRRGLQIVTSQAWGFPLFSVQKWLTRRTFTRVRGRYMHGGLDSWKKTVFAAAYYAHFVNDLFAVGPQIFIHAKKLPFPLNQSGSTHAR